MEFQGKHSEHDALNDILRRYILENDPTWDVVISDYVLPAMDGGALLKKAKELPS